MAIYGCISSRPFRFCYRGDVRRANLRVTRQRRRHKTLLVAFVVVLFNGAKTNPFSLGRWATPSLSLLGLSLPPLAVYSIWRTVTRVRASPRETIVHGGIASFFHCSWHHPSALPAARAAARAIMERDHRRYSGLHSKGGSGRKKAWSLLPQ